MSATHTRPSAMHRRAARTAWRADRPGRNPNEDPEKPGSKTGVSTCAIAWQISLSRQVGRHPQQPLAARGLGDHHPADRRRPVRTRVQRLADLCPVLAQPRHKLLRGHAVRTRRARVGPDTPQRPAQILRREHPLPQGNLQAGDDSILGARRPAATLSCGTQRNSPSPPGNWPASAGWLRSPRPARATPIPPSHLTFGPSRPLT